jgi:hypothetical protein
MYERNSLSVDMILNSNHREQQKSKLGYCFLLKFPGCTVETQIYPKTIQLHQKTRVSPANMEIHGTVCMHMYIGQGVILYTLAYKNCYNEHDWRL